MPRDDRLLVRFHTRDVDAAGKDRLWRDLLDHAIEHVGGDSFSAQMDLLDENLPAQARQARDSLLAHARLQRPRRSVLPLKPPRWPLEPATRRWIEEAGPWIYRLTIWNEDAWVLESELWGNSFSIVVRPDEWSRLQEERASVAALTPPPTSEPFRKEDERVRRGWALSRRMRALAAIAVAVLITALSRLEGGWGWLFIGPFMGLLAYFFLPSREPGPVARLVARVRFPTDPSFNRRFQWISWLAAIGGVFATLGAPLAYTADPGSSWRVAFASFAVVGGIVLLFSVGITTWWAFKYRRKVPPQARERRRPRT
jgi:hypothetical protein